MSECVFEFVIYSADTDIEQLIPKIVVLTETDI